MRNIIIVLIKIVTSAEEKTASVPILKKENLPVYFVRIVGKHFTDRTVLPRTNQSFVKNLKNVPSAVKRTSIPRKRTISAANIDAPIVERKYCRTINVTFSRLERS